MVCPWKKVVERMRKEGCFTEQDELLLAKIREHVDDLIEGSDCDD